MRGSRSAGQCRLNGYGHGPWGWGRGIKSELADNPNCYLYFDKDGVRFKEGQAGRILLYIPEARLDETLRKRWRIEREIQERCSNGPANKKTKSTPSTEDREADVLIVCRCHVIWFLEHAPPTGFEGSFSGLAVEFEEQFSRSLLAQDMRRMMIVYAGWIPVTNWSMAQRIWIAQRASEGRFWDDLVEPFNTKFNQSRTSAELREQYDTIYQVAQPDFPEDQKAAWVKTTQFERLKSSLGITRFHRSRWSKAEVELLVRLYIEGKGYPEIVDEISQQFGKQKSVMACKIKLETYRREHPDTEGLTYNKTQWSTEEIELVKKETQGKGLQEVDWPRLSTLLWTTYQTKRTECAIRGKYWDLKLASNLQTGSQNSSQS